MDPVVLNGVTPLTQLGVIRAEGPDAASFVHGQLTQDIALLGPGEGRLAALCSAKGRMLASFLVLRPAPERVLLVTGLDLLPATLKRLAMYKLRARLELTDASAEFALYGVAGTALVANGLDAGAAPGQRQVAAEDGIGAVALYPADGVPRALWIAPAGGPAPQGPALPESLWLWSEVRSGVATLSTPVADAFVPQMLNYESVGGVNFKKGCYPGQEVVARSQYRGTLKRRGFLVQADAPLSVGQEVFSPADAEQPVGTVAQAAAGPHGRWAGLVSLQLAALDAGPLHAGAVDGPVLAIDPLPYALRADI